MKSGTVGTSDSSDSKKRSYKSSRELYTKKINELELSTRQLRDQSRNFKVTKS